MESGGAQVLRSTYPVPNLQQVGSHAASFSLHARGALVVCFPGQVFGLKATAKRFVPANTFPGFPPQLQPPFPPTPPPFPPTPPDGTVEAAERSFVEQGESDF